MTIGDYAIGVAAVGALGAAACAGIYHVFLVTIVPVLGSGDARTAAAVMRAINRRITRTGFMLLFGGTSLLALASMLLSLTLTGMAGQLMLIAGLVHLLGMSGVTIAGNVPLNRRLDAAPPEDGAAWTAFAPGWQRFNHLRAVASAVAALIWIAVLTL